MSGDVSLVDWGHTYDSWWFEWEILSGSNVTLRIDRIYEEKGAIWSEFSASVMVGHERQTVLTPSRTNLLNAARNGWKQHSDAFEDFAPDFPWGLCLQSAVEKTLMDYRAGNKPEDLTVGWDDDDGENFLLDPFIANSGVSVLYGEGGLGKSVLALALGLAVCTDSPIFNVFPTRVGPVVYFDYEDDSLPHKRRLKALMEGHGVKKLAYPYHHQVLVAKVNQAQSDMRRVIGETHAVMAVVDSIGMGRGGDSMGSEDTIRFFRSLRSFDVPVLALDHLSKIERTKEDPTPYGSIYTMNSSRLAWAAVTAESSTVTTKHINLTNTKANHVAKSKPKGIEVKFIQSERKLSQITMALFDEAWTPTENTWQQIEHCLDKNSDIYMSTSDLAEELMIPKDTVAKALQRNPTPLYREKAGRAYVYQLVRHASRAKLFDQGEPDELGQTPVKE
jgi:hypothetical protein